MRFCRADRTRGTRPIRTLQTVTIPIVGYSREYFAACGGLGHAAQVDGFTCLTKLLDIKIPSERLANITYPDGIKAFVPRRKAKFVNKKKFSRRTDKKKHAKIVNEPATDSESGDDASEKASSESEEEEKGKMVSLLAQSWSGTPRADSEGGSSDDSI